jgi:hypothetical protein
MGNRGILQMSHFLIHAARLQDAGVSILTVTLHAQKDGTRMMTVTPNGNYPVEVHRQWPARDFELCGTDRLLEQLQDDMAYAEGGPTPEALAAAIERHPLAADDLREWYADWLATPPLADEDIAEAEDHVPSESVDRIVNWTKGVMRGLDIAKARDAMKTNPTASGGVTVAGHQTFASPHTHGSPLGGKVLGGGNAF